VYKDNALEIMKLTEKLDGIENVVNIIRSYLPQTGSATTLEYNSKRQQK
jgi:hypothetical protein